MDTLLYIYVVIILAAHLWLVAVTLRWALSVCFMPTIYKYDKSLKLRYLLKAMLYDIFFDMFTWSPKKRTEAIERRAKQYDHI